MLILHGGYEELADLTAGTIVIHRCQTGVKTLLFRSQLDRTDHNMRPQNNIAKAADNLPNETRRPLSMRELEVLILLAEGNSMPTAARCLNITPRTVAYHKYRIMDALGVKSNAELVRRAVGLRLVGT